MTHKEHLVDSSTVQNRSGATKTPESQEVRSERWASAVVPGAATASALSTETYHNYRERALEAGGEEIREQGGRELWPDEPDEPGVTYRLVFIEQDCLWTVFPPLDYVRPDELKVEAI